MGIRRQISGIDILLAIDPAGGTDYKFVVCLTTNSLERTTAVIDAASKCGPYYLPGVQSIQIPFTFNEVLDTDDMVEMSEEALHPLWANKTIVGWKYGPADPQGGDLTFTGIGFIGELKRSDPDNAVSSVSSTLYVQGAITMTKTGS